LELNKIVYFSATIAAALFVVALTLFLLSPDQRDDRYSLAFPDTAGGALHNEWRILPNRSGARERIHMLLEEMMLGPVSLGAVPFLPETSELQSVLYDRSDRTVYIDFDPSFVVQSENGLFPFADLTALIERNLRHNVTGIDRIIVTIDGQLPGAPRFEGL